MPGKYIGKAGCVACSPMSRGEEGPEMFENVEHMELCGGYADLWGEEYSDTDQINFLMKVMEKRKRMMTRK